MAGQTQLASQGLLFSEPSICETGVWCTLNPEIDPAQWAGFCRSVGQMRAEDFKKVEKKVLPCPDSLKSRLMRIFKFRQEDCVGIPIVYTGNGGIVRQV